jgi:hypothetical protein
MKYVSHPNFQKTSKKKEGTMKKFYVTSIGILFMVSAVLLLGQSLVFAETCQIVRITAEKGAAGTRIEITPEKATVPLDTCVVWVNWVTECRVRVAFKENAKQCKLSTDSQVGFEMAEGEECYLTEYLTRGKTASMYFNKPGTFKYTLELEGKPAIKAEGVIEIK